MLATRAVTARHTWELGRATILAALLNAIAILVGVGAVTWEAVQCLSDPVAVPGLTVMLVALVGIGVNTGSALLFMSARKGELNAKGAFLHGRRCGNLGRSGIGSGRDPVRRLGLA